MARLLRRIGLGAALAAALVALAPLAHPYFEPASWWYPVVGVDVSNHQGEIDWPALASSGIAFAFIKATEGGDFRDRSFTRNWAEAERNGLARGAYHFFTLCRPADEQARNFIATVPHDPRALPPVVDAEHMGPCRDGREMTDVVGELDRFMDALEHHYGQRPLIYTTEEFDTAKLGGALAEERFWARSLVFPPRFRGNQWVIWQYHNRGRRPGVVGPLDLNVFRGTLADFQRFATVRRPAATGQ